jgi:hypothetical protein
VLLQLAENVVELIRIPGEFVLHLSRSPELHLRP